MHIGWGKAGVSAGGYISLQHLVTLPETSHESTFPGPLGRILQQKGLPFLINLEGALVGLDPY